MFIKTKHWFIITSERLHQSEIAIRSFDRVHKHWSSDIVKHMTLKLIYAD